MLRMLVSPRLAGIGLLVILCGSFDASTPACAGPIRATPAHPDTVRSNSTSADTAHAKVKGALITEIGIHTAITKSESYINDRYGTIDVGYLARTGAKTFVGGDVSFTFHDDGSFWAIEPRVRYEFDQDWWLDVAAGPIVSATAQSHNLDGFSMSAYAMVNHRGFIGATLGVHSLDYGPVGVYYGVPGEGPYAGRVTSTWIGVQVGNGPGVIGVLVFGILGLAAVASLSS